jgi:lipopolysaccharide transport system ATP-binding protein
MSQAAIEARNLGKRYYIARMKRPYKTLREQIESVFHWGGPTVRGKDKKSDQLWALQNITLDVHPGEVLGVIGRNGAGKSTLLKILSRIVEPTIGQAHIRGKVGCLLEVGTGFHPELSGRENVFLNGAILGMAKQEIERRFDQIVSFAEVEEFIETPIKHYSSGMAVRLAFAVAAHLETNIMLIDEVLAVGDASFKRKCTNLLRNLITDGRTVIIVSHNTGLIRSLCSRVILLEKGCIFADGSPSKVINTYHQLVFSGESGYKVQGAKPSKTVFVSHAYLSDEGGHPVTQVPCGQKLRLNLQFQGTSDATIFRPKIHVRIYSSTGQYVSYVASQMAGYQLPPISDQTSVVCQIEGLHLVPGEYYLGFIIADGNRIYDEAERAIGFTVETADYFGSGEMPDKRHGQVLLKSRWWAADKAGVPAVAE